MVAGDSSRDNPWTFTRAEGPVLATAIHGGHDLRPGVSRLMVLGDAERLREEDPYTGEWTAVGDGGAVVHRSRFEVDLNRDRECCVYLEPGDCWGLKVWSPPLPHPEVERSRALHDRFYGELGTLLEETSNRFGRFVLLDLHTYNHRRGGAGAPAAPQAENPDVNIGTGSVNRRAWGGLIDRLIYDLRGYEVNGRPLDVRENVKFVGAHLVEWVNSHFRQGCAIAVEVKKIFMDEITGALDPTAHKQVHRALEGAAAGCRDWLGN